MKPSTSPTLQSGIADNSTQGYKQLASNTFINNNTTTPNNQQAKEQQIYSKNANVSGQNNQTNLHKVDLVQPESFTKPTSIPPIGKLLEEPSPTSQIKPIESQLLSIKKPESFGPITEQFIDVDDVPKIEDLPKMPEIDSMENIFKNEDFDREFKFKRNVINKTSFKNTHRGFITTKPTFTMKRWQKSKKKRFRVSTHFRHLKSLARIRRRVWTRRTVKNKHEVLMIAPYETKFSLKQLKKKVQNMLLGKREDKSYRNRKKVFIPPPPPIQMKSLEPFKKEKEIEDISKETIKIDQPEPIEGIDKHLQTIDNQPEIKPISDHLIQNEPLKDIDDIEPIEPISSVQSN